MIALSCAASTQAQSAGSGAPVRLARADVVRAIGNEEAVADDGAPGADNGAIVVTGQRSRDAVLLEQKAGISVANIVSGETLRQQPQSNLADLLTRLPGLSASVDQSRNQAATGESQYLTIRGLDTAYNAYMINGVRMAQTDAASRAVSMNLLSPFGLGSVKVDKAPGADVDGDAIAGVVDLRTASAFDFTGPMTRVHVAGQAAGRALARDQDGLGYIVQGEAARTFGSDGAFGIYVNAYYQNKDTAGESVALQRDPEKLNRNIPGTLRDNPDNIYARGVQWNFYRNSIERFGANLSLDYKGETTQLYLRGNYGAYHLDSANDQASIRQELVTGSDNPFQQSLRAGLGFQSKPNPDGGDYAANGIRMDYGTMPGEYHRTENSRQSLLSMQAGGSTTAERLTIDYSGAYSRGKQAYPLRIQSAFYGFPYIGTNNQAGAAVEPLITSIADNNDPRAILTPDAAAYVADLNNTRQWYVEAGQEFSKEAKWEAKGNVAWAASSTLTIKAGGKYEHADRHSNNIATDGENRYLLEVQPDGSYRQNPDRPFWGPGGLTSAAYPGEVLDGFMGAGPQVPIKLMDIGEMERMARTLALSLPLDGDVLLRNRVDGREIRASAYVQAKFDLGPLTIVPGVRYEYNKFSADYYQDDDGTLVPAASSRDYDQFLPSVLATYRPDDRTVFRAAIRKSYARPAFDQLVGATQVTRDTDGTIIGIYQPNANLKPVTAINYDLGAEYYDGSGGLLQVSAYYKQLKNVIFATGSTNTRSDFNAWNGAPVSVNGVDVTSLSNSEGGRVYGVELNGRKQFAALPGIWGGFGLQGNLTLQSTRGTVPVSVGGVLVNRDLRLPKAPNILFNAELFYARDAVAASLGYRYAGTVLNEVRSDRPDVYLQPTKQLNFNASYAFRNGLSVGVAVENILNDYAYWATYGPEKTVLSADRRGGYVETGRVFQINASFVF